MKQGPSSTRKERDANQYAEELLQSIEEIQPAQPRPYMHSRVLARMDALIGQDQLPSFLLAMNRQLNIAVLTVMIILNTSALWYYVDNRGITFGQNATAEEIIEDYQLDYRSTYAYLEE